MFKFIARLMRFSGKDSWKLKLSAVLSVLDGIFSSVPIFAAYLVITKMIDGNIANSDILNSFLIVLGSLVARWLTRYIYSSLSSDAAVHVAARDRLKIGDLFKRYPMSYFTDGNIGNVTSVVTGDLVFIENFGMLKLDDVITGITSMIIGCGFLFGVDWRIALSSIAACLIALLVFRGLEKITKKHARERQEQAAKITGAVLEHTDGIAVVKSLRLTGSAAKRMDKSIEDACEKAIDFEKSLLTPMSLYQNCFSLSIAAALFIGFWLCFGGTITIPVMIMTAIFIFQIYRPAAGLAGSATLMRVMEAGMDRYEKLKEVPVIDADGKDIELKKFDIQFDDVSFSYEQKQTLQNISFTAKEHSMTALVGASGSGKTTIANLIVRFWDAQKGSIKIGGVDIRKMTCDSLLRYVSMVFQRVYLFNDTIENNIRFGKPNASRDEIIEAAKKARCHDFISALPNGYDTIVGEGGSTLSGGEKQRISIARAILKDAPIVLLDEATASVDPDNEKHIQEAINELVRNKTLIVIAHRLSTIKNADQILVIDEGKIVEKGTHKQLAEKDGYYAKLWQRRQKAKSWKIAK